MRVQAVCSTILRLISLAGLAAGLLACTPDQPPTAAPVEPSPQPTRPALSTALTTPTPRPTQEPSMTPTLNVSPYQVIAYFPEWGGRQSYTVKSIEQSGSADKVTIINYAFGLPGPDPETGQVVCRIDDAQAAYGQVYSAEMSIDGQADDPKQPLRGHFNQLRKLKAKYPQLKVVISLGGWTGSGWFSDAARTAETRQQFVTACIDLFIRGNLPEINGAGGVGAGAGVFDGIDLDWEYPIKDGLPETHYHPADGANYVLLLKEFRRQYAELGRPNLLLTMAAPGPAQAAQYNLPEGHPYLDIISIMTYDLVNGYSKTTGHHTNLCTPADDPTQLSAEQAVRLYRDTFGIPASKLMIGAAFYGRAWRNVPDENHGLYQPGEPWGEGMLNYRDLAPRIAQGDVTRYWDQQAKAPWLYSAGERTFWTYDDPETLRLKAQYVRHFGLGGVMFWEISGDEPQGTLVDTLYRELTNPSPVPDPCSE